MDAIAIIQKRITLAECLALEAYEANTVADVDLDAQQQVATDHQLGGK
ncbi:MAG: hypothetical protein ABL908_09360 [Hyphomicrobium sp.]